MHLTTEAGDPVAPALFEEDTLGIAPNIVLPEPLPDEDDSGDDQRSGASAPAGLVNPGHRRQSRPGQDALVPGQPCGPPGSKAGMPPL